MIFENYRSGILLLSLFRHLSINKKKTLVKKKMITLERTIAQWLKWAKFPMKMTMTKFPGKKWFILPFFIPLVQRRCSCTLIFIHRKFSNIISNMVPKVSKCSTNWCRWFGNVYQKFGYFCWTSVIWTFPNIDQL